MTWLRGEVRHFQNLLVRFKIKKSLCIIYYKLKSIQFKNILLNYFNFLLFML